MTGEFGESQFSIEVGQMGDISYLGISPPVDQEIRDKVVDFLNAVTPDVDVYLREPEQGVTHTEISWPDDSPTDKGYRVACVIRGINRGHRIGVNFDSTVKTLGQGIHLFSI